MLLGTSSQLFILIMSHKMSQEQIFSGLKKDVRSLLISAKLGLTPDQLRRDYKDMLGSPMPLSLLGFRSVLDMTREMPDVVYVDYLSDGSLVLKAVADDATRGIVELVARQRSVKKSPARRASMGSFSPRFQQQRPIVLARRSHAPPALPAHLRAQLRQLLSQGPLGLSQLENAFSLRFGFPLRVSNYGFYSIAEMLAVASDMIMVSQSRTGSLLSLKRADVLPPVRMGPVKPVFPPKQTVNTVPVIRPKTTTNSVQVVKPSPQNHVLPSHDHAVPDIPKGDQGSQPMECTPPQPAQNGQDFQKCVIKLEEELRQRILENGQAGTVSPELKAKLRQVVAQKSEGISIHDLPAEYKRVFGEELPVVQNGFLSATEMVGALSDTLSLRPVAGHEDNHWMVVDIQHAPEHRAGSPSEPEGHGERGYYVSGGGSSWEGREEEDDSHPDKEEDPELKITTKTFHQMVAQYGSVTVQCRRGALVPPDAIRGQRLRPPTRRSPRELVPVLVERVESPSLFYIRFDESQEARALENMMIEMRSCYTTPEVSERYRLPERYVRLGQVCCVAPQGVWFYRVVVHQVLSRTQAEVYYVDFGDITTVQISSLKFLKSCYSELPAQAVPSSLVGIKPFGGSWSEAATTSFQKLCCERTLVAALHSYHGHFLQLYLCDTYTEEDVYIHSALQAQGHGLSCAPAISAELCGHFNPVSLYLGEGLLDEGREIEDEDPALEPGPDAAHTSPQRHTTPSPTHTTPKDKNVLPDLPALELIEVNSTSQGVLKANPFVALQSKDPLCCSEWDQGWTPSPTPPPNPGVVQSDADLGYHGDADLGYHGDTAKMCSPGVAELKQSRCAEGALTTVPPPSSTLNTLGRMQTPSAYGMSMFPLFGTGNVLHVSSPLALGSSARLATGAGSYLLNWHPHKRA
ncbi:tudor domain-containing protein 5 isoform X2 [Esox lucius]|uniref:Tudor domain-containing protein 5 n=1 Tax=Esox lucius TaxID=8010 RepID=A0A3P8XEZ0_ESOLU|nr:tudor domain-containing protein 5 isoform X2 [Esox lucius]